MKLKQPFILFLIFLIFGVCAVLPLPWNEEAEHFFLDLKFKLRGNREFSDKIVLVFIGQEDIQDMGGWPITRDYYVYVTWLLKQRGAKVIGFDILFSTKDTRYPEFDDTMSSFFESADNVCVPMMFQEWSRNKSQTSADCYKGEAPLFPIPVLASSLSGTGFSNLGEDAFQRKVPLFTHYEDSLILSLGAEMARLFLADKNSAVSLQEKNLVIKNDTATVFNFPFENDDCLYLNHFGNLSRLPAISLIELIQPSDEKPDSLDFTDKLAFIAVTAPGRASLKATPLTQALPASLIHLTLAENLIEQNYLKNIPAFWLWLILFLLFTSLWLLWRHKQQRFRTIGSIVGIFIFWLISFLFFSIFNLIMPTFYPTFAYLGAFLYLFISHTKKREQRNLIQQKILQKEIEDRNSDLNAARKKLSEFQIQMQTELAEKTELSTETEAQLKEHRQRVLELEKKIRDLEAFHETEQTERVRPDSEIKFTSGSKLAQVMALIERIRDDNIPVLISGETGTGKEVVARAIHRKSQRKNWPFIAVNCGALPETLLESELFGHEKGSFTGAHARRRGRFELADGGTLFLDEITETNPAFQARLLRALQEGTIERLGSEQSIKVNARIIAASNKDVKQAVAQGEFRADLFYRLNGFPIELPPLRERVEDIPLLVTTFLAKHGYQSVENFSTRAIEMLKIYAWPGNVRELENVVRRAAIMARSEGRKLIQIKDLPPEISENTTAPAIDSIHKPLEDQILEMLRTLNFSHTSISQTAKALGNRDRGTITEYFRGICFENLVQTDFSVPAAAQQIVGAENTAAIEKVTSKIENYLENIRAFLNSDEAVEMDENAIQTRFKGLPKKYHPFLMKVIENLRHETASE